MRRTLAVVLLSFAAGTGVVAAAQPAAADDCAQQVKGIGDLGDEAVIQDCLRTGGNWGRVLGTVIAASALLAAGAGLAGTSGVKTPAQPSQDPCRAMTAASRELHRLRGELKAMEPQIIADWRKYQLRANRLATEFRLIKETEMYASQAQAWHTAGFAAFAAMAIYGLVVAGQAVVGAAATAATVLPAAGPGSSTALITAEQAAAVTAADAALLQAKLNALYAAVGSLGSSVPFWNDPIGLEAYNETIRALMKQAANYNREARAFNKASQAWAMETQRKLNDKFDAMEEAAQRYKANADACRGPGNEVTPITVQRVDLQVMQVPTEIGGRWSLIRTLSPWG